MRYFFYLLFTSFLLIVTHESKAQVSFGLNAETQTVVLHKKNHFSTVGTSNSLGGIIQSRNEKNISYQASLLINLWTGSYEMEPPDFVNQGDPVRDPDYSRNFNIVDIKIPFGIYKYTNKNQVFGGGAYVSTWVFNKISTESFSFNNAPSVNRFDYGLNFQFGWIVKRIELLLMAEYSFRDRLSMSSGSIKINKYSTGLNMRYLF